MVGADVRNSMQGWASGVSIAGVVGYVTSLAAALSASHPELRSDESELDGRSGILEYPLSTVEWSGKESKKT